MIILNFSHPLTPAQVADLERMAGQPAEQVLDAPAHFDVGQSFAAQARALLDGLPLAPDAWQSAETRLLVVPPALGVLAAVLLAEMHGRMGHFPSVARIRPVGGPFPGYEAAEIINLQAVRHQARPRR